MQTVRPISSGGAASNCFRDAPPRFADLVNDSFSQRRTQQRAVDDAFQLGAVHGVGRIARLLQAAREASLARLDATRLGRQVGHRTTLELLNAESDASAAELALTQWRSAVALDRLRLLQLAGALEEATLAQP